MSMANMSADEYLTEALVLEEKLPSPETIKLHKGQCSSLRSKLRETLNYCAEEVDRHVEKLEPEGPSCSRPSYNNPVLRRYCKLFRELLLVVQRVKIFVDDCCYNNENERDDNFVLAAIRVSAHRERFLKYYVELDWCHFLVKCLKDTATVGESVSSETLEDFVWERKVNSLVEVTRAIVDNDFQVFNDLLKKHVEEQGDHQKICVTLLRRFGDSTVLDNVEHGVPPLDSIGYHIGNGGFGGVYEFIWKNTPFAVKTPSSNSAVQTLDTEVKILEKCSHQNIVNLVLFHRRQPDGKQYLMMERLSMDLLEHIREGFPFSRSEEVDMILQISEGMRYLSEGIRYFQSSKNKHLEVSHRDLKPQNILVRKRKEGPVELQVADFGLAKVRAKLGMDSANTPNNGTTRYRAPEMTVEISSGRRKKILQKSLKADIYSFAVTCSCILTGKEPYEDKLQQPKGMKKLRDFVKNRGRPRLPDHCPQELSSLLQQCWDPKPSHRPASFADICEKLRELKAKLLVTCDHVDKGDEPGPSIQKNNRVPFNSDCNRPLRILVLGAPNAVKAAISSMCGPSAPGHTVEDHPIMRESWTTSPSMHLYRALYRDRTLKRGNINDFKAIKTFVESRNKSWHQKMMNDAWKKDLHGWKIAEFPNSSLRLHMVWLVCTGNEDLPNSLQWDEVTNKLYGLPVQMLVTETHEYGEILNDSDRYFRNPNNQKLKVKDLKDLIMEVDLITDIAAVKEKLWHTCWAVKTCTEIENAAMIIWAIRKRIGPDGIPIPVNATVVKPKEFSVEQSKDFILNFLCTFWDIPKPFLDFLVGKIRAQQQQGAPKSFVLFCLQTAASILYSERQHLLGLVPAVLTSEFLETEAQDCSQEYFQNLDVAVYDDMRFGDIHIQAFLRAVFFEEHPVPCPLVSHQPDGNYSSFPKILNVLNSFSRSKRCLMGS